jgi:hypothetical protein
VISSDVSSLPPSPTPASRKIRMIRPVFSIWGRPVGQLHAAAQSRVVDRQRHLPLAWNMSSISFT